MKMIAKRSTCIRRRPPSATPPRPLDLDVDDIDVDDNVLAWSLEQFFSLWFKNSFTAKSVLTRG